MPLLRQIGSTDAQALLAASGGRVGDATLNPTDPVVLNPPPVATSVTVPIPVDAIDPSLKTVLWAGLGLGVGWWLGHGSDGDGVVRAGTVGKGGKSLTPLLVIGGLAVAAWYFLKPATATTSTIPATGPGGLSLSQADTARAWLLNTFQASNAGNEVALKAAVPQMTDDEVVSFYNVLQYIQQQGAAFNGSLPAAMLNTYNFIMQKYMIPGL